MADPDSAVEVYRNGVVSGSVARRSPDAIVAEIEQTRENLARAIDNIADLVSPANNIRRLRERAAEQASRPQVQLAAVAVGVAVVGIVVLRIWARRRK